MARVGAMMRMMMGALETEGGVCFQAKHISGKENKLAGGITRWPEDQVYNNLMRESPGTPWQVQELGAETRRNLRRPCEKLLFWKSCKVDLRELS